MFVLDKVKKCPVHKSTQHRTIYIVIKILIIQFDVIIYNETY